MQAVLSSLPVIRSMFTPTTIKRWRRAWAYARNRMTQDDASWIAYECDIAAGSFTLVSIETDDVLDLARDRWGDVPELRALADAATRRVWNKWSSSGDERNAAIDWAIDLIAEYAREDGIELIEQAHLPIVATN